MKILNKDYFKCESCNTEAHDMIEINKKFGYIIKEDVIYPQSLCKECMSRLHPEKQEKKRREYKERQWATAARWGRNIHINKRTFNSYLIDLGYLERVCSEAGKVPLQMTEVGQLHSKREKTIIGERILWDFDTYLNVAKRRAENADIHDICPKCKAFLDTVPGYNHLDYSHQCSKCGHICEVWEVSVNFDR